ncbi:DNA starvation/stationary phase protection protein [Heyndrickxia coagulans]|uniref:Dps family protein n=1 Tax=Heyndrickxia coagulans TaxID=1398 RepID=UPI002E06451F|nr:DNA starvation/stationary phase protection protein [Heyndrickxia coagulans]MED4942871.1 DNA starvation/stationary phase protection protein [Heyndrickxia coagulans]MED4965231.1 DNA starvation/stationary phase protection protein [Heyndrickxia coagulans]
MDEEKLVRFLNQELSNFTVLYIKLHRYHWYIQGKNFFTLHAYFEDLYQAFSKQMDVLAERVLAIGGRPLATMSKFLDRKSLVEASADNEEGELLQQLREDLAQLAKEIRETGISLAEERKDDATVNLLTRFLARFDKDIWMLDAMADKR